LPAILLSVVALFGLPDYPETAKFLTEKERIFLKGRLAKTAPAGQGRNWDFKAIKDMLRNPTFYTFSLYWVCHAIGGFGIGYALPTVIYELGFTTTTNSQLMNIVSCSTRRPCDSRQLTVSKTSASLRLSISFPQHSRLPLTKEDHTSMDNGGGQ
jgi:hypothetical protein